MSRRPRIVIVGAGFAGYRAARTLARLGRNRVDVTLLNPTDYFLYLPLLLQVAAGILDPRLGIGRRRRYHDRDVGFVVELGGVQAAADPLGVPLSGPPAGLVTRGYHLAAMPAGRARVAADWLFDAVLPCQGVQLGLVRSWSVPLDTASPELPKTPQSVTDVPPEGAS